MKKFAALVLAGAMTLGLAACGGGNTSTPAASTPAASTPAASTGSDYASLDPVVLRGADSSAWAPLPSSWVSWLPRRWTPSLAAS